MVDVEPMILDELERLASPETFEGADWREVLRRARPRSLVRRRRTLGLVAAALALLCAGAGIAGVVLVRTNSEEEHALLAGHTVFAGTRPACTNVAAMEFRCILERQPTGLRVEGSYRGTKVQTVDGNDRVDGGCIAISDDGRIWTCYVGELAVERGVLSPGVLGHYQPGPAHG
jgi:hypothetical protein